MFNFGRLGTKEPSGINDCQRNGIMRQSEFLGGRGYYFFRTYDFLVGGR